MKECQRGGRTWHLEEKVLMAASLHCRTESVVGIPMVLQFV
jgi:hypothetical protein